jgi:hypothetical protein
MIEEGQEKTARYWGKFKVKKVVKLTTPIVCHSGEVGEVEFMPTIIQIEWENPPSWDKHEFWLPYWIKIKGKERYGQFAPMIGKSALLQLLKGAVKQDFFDKTFLLELAKAIKEKIDGQNTAK